MTDVNSKGVVSGDALASLGDRLMSLQWEWQICSDIAALRIAIIALHDKNYDVVVCGEVKREKTSFVNAFLGRELLLAGVREATSQVFRVSGGDAGSFALVCDDGCWQEVASTVFGCERFKMLNVFGLKGHK